MADEGCLTIQIETGEPEIIWCGNEFLARVPLLVDGKEIGDVIVDSEDCE